MDLAASATLYAGLHIDGEGAGPVVFKTTDAGASWALANAGLPGIG